MNLLEQIRRIERLDQLIRLKTTGTPIELAKRMNVSRRTLYNILEFMKRQGADIYYCSYQHSFCYKEEIYFHFGFSLEKVSLSRIRGGEKYIVSDFIYSAEFLHSSKVYLQRSYKKEDAENPNS